MITVLKLRQAPIMQGSLISIERKVKLRQNDYLIMTVTDDRESAVSSKRFTLKSSQINAVF